MYMWQPGGETGVWNWRGSLEGLKSCRMWCYLQVDSVNIELDWVELKSGMHSWCLRIACGWCGWTDRYVGIGPRIICIHFLILNLESQCRFKLEDLMWPLPTPILITVLKPLNWHMWGLATISQATSRTCIQGVEIKKMLGLMYEAVFLSHVWANLHFNNHCSTLSPAVGVLRDFNRWLLGAHTLLLF